MYHSLNAKQRQYFKNTIKPEDTRFPYSNTALLVPRESFISPEPGRSLCWRALILARVEESTTSPRALWGNFGVLMTRVAFASLVPYENAPLVHRGAETETLASTVTSPILGPVNSGRVDQVHWLHWQNSNISDIWSLSTQNHFNVPAEQNKWLTILVLIS